MKKSVYFDATIPNFMYDQRQEAAVFVRETNSWWSEEREYFDIWASEATLDEVGSGDYPHKDRAIEFASHLHILPPDPEIIEIAQTYIDHYLMPQSLKGDALHLAYASFYKMDFLLTWNCTHLANANKTQHIAILNTRLQLAVPEITTPLQLVHEERFL